jgi:primosomal replication protein N
LSSRVTEQSANWLQLSAAVVEKSPLRYTPSGLAALDFWLEQQVSIIDAGRPRQNQLRLKAVAFDQMAETLDRLPLGETRNFSGFLSNARYGKSVVFHIQNLI